MSTYDQSIVDLARGIATRAHEGQTRKDGKTPYIVHPEAVAKAVEACFSPFTSYESYVAAAWLHDVLEDTSVTVQDLVRHGIPSDVIAAVEILTKREDENYLFYLRKVSRNDIARVVKICDLNHNLSDLNRLKNKHQHDKYVLALWILEHRIRL